MRKMTYDMFLSLIENKKEHFAIVINHWFYYVEKGKIYRFQQHQNLKMVTALGEMYQGELTKEHLMDEIKQSIIKQIQYDWFTDVWKDIFLEKLEENPTEMESFFF